MILHSWNPGLLPMCCCETCVGDSQLSYRSSESPQAVLCLCNFKPFILQRQISVSLSAIFRRQHGISRALVKCKILRQWQCKLASIKIAHYWTETCGQGLAVAHSMWLLWKMYCEVWCCLSYCGCCTQKVWIYCWAMGHGWLGCLHRRWALMCPRSQNRHILFFWHMVTCVGI
jgi:hypothetical protein